MVVGVVSLKGPVQTYTGSTSTVTSRKRVPRVLRVLLHDNGRQTLMESMRSGRFRVVVFWTSGSSVGQGPSVLISCFTASLLY